MSTTITDEQDKPQVKFVTPGDLYVMFIQFNTELNIEAMPMWAKAISGIYNYKDAQNNGYAPTDEQRKILDAKITKTMNDLYDDPKFSKENDVEAAKIVTNKLVETLAATAKENNWQEKWVKELPSFKKKLLVAKVQETVQAQHRVAKDALNDALEYKRRADESNNLEVIPPDKIPSQMRKEASTHR